jgi:hypothetical protein
MYKTVQNVIITASSKLDEDCLVGFKVPLWSVDSKILQKFPKMNLTKDNDKKGFGVRQLGLVLVLVLVLVLSCFSLVLSCFGLVLSWSWSCLV